MRAGPPAYVTELSVTVDDGRAIVDRVSFAVERGEVLGMVGESGSGKSTTALALLGFSRPGCTIAAGSVAICGEQMLGRDAVEVRRLRGRLVSYVPQDPGSSLNPAIRIGDQLHELLRIHAPDRNTLETVEEVLSSVSLPHDQPFRRRFPHQLSGGQQQRVALAMALVNRPALLVLDEPTTGLDVLVQASIVRELQRLQDELHIAMVFVSHNLAVVAQLAHRMVVMKDGRLVETKPTQTILRAPEHEYTRRLIAAAAISEPLQSEQEPSKSTRSVATDRRGLLGVHGLTIAYRSPLGTVIAADDVSFEVRVAETVALVGESGSGKTSIGRSVAGLVAPERGTIELDGRPLAAIAARRTREQRRRVQIVFQNPYESLNPRHSVIRAIARPARLLFGLPRAEAERRGRELLERVRLAERVAHRYPRELSGGERQRVAVARALAAQPDLLVCDEITSSLDVSVQASLLELLAELRSSLGLALLFITHDLTIVEAIADHVVVLKAGKVREVGSAARVLRAPEDEYTRALVIAAPRLDPAPVGALGTNSQTALVQPT